jgi:hypothetical protein
MPRFVYSSVKDDVSKRIEHIFSRCSSNDTICNIAIEIHLPLFSAAEYLVQAAIFDDDGTSFRIQLRERERERDVASSRGAIETVELCFSCERKHKDENERRVTTQERFVLVSSEGDLRNTMKKHKDKRRLEMSTSNIDS